MIDTTTSTTSLTSTADNPYVNPDGILGKDDFMNLLLVELQNQDPTDPMDSDKILSQTSELATLESADNTNKALEELSVALTNSQQYSVIGAIGKTASLGSDAIEHAEGTTSSFEIYFPDDVKSGTVEITDLDGNLVRTIELGENAQGVYAFDWDGVTDEGTLAEDGIYRVQASYTTPSGESKATAVGTYPIESVRFDNGDALLKLGSNYVPMDQVVEIY